MQFSKLTILCASAACLAIAACDDTNNTPDAGPDGGLPPELECKVDNANKPETAIPLPLGTRFQGDTFICPPTDFDWYQLDLPPGQPLVTVELAFNQGLFSAVDLAYEIFAAGNTDMPIATGRDENTQDNRSSVVRTHFLSETGGLHYIRVRDNGNDEQDSKNAYALTITTSADPDQNEPNDDCASAKPLVGNATGVIGADGDKDAFKLNIPAGSQIVDINLTTAEMSNVDFRLALIEPDGSTGVATEVDTRGEDGPTDLTLRRGITSVGGDYCILIEDDDGADANQMTIYTLSAQVMPETDPNEVTSRNDEPSTATVLPGNGGTVTGQIGSKADLDWYKVTAAPGKIIQVDFDCPSCWTNMQPSIVYVYPDTDTACDSTSQCDYLLRGSGDCVGDTDCGSGVCRDTPNGRRCGVSCGGGGDEFGDLDCKSFQCQQSANVTACAAVGSCMAEGTCGVQQVYFPQPADIASGLYSPGDRIRTAQPAQANATYILVHDFNDDNDSPAQYSVSITVHDDPDAANEPDNFYMPIREANLINEAFYRGGNRRQVGWVNTGGRAVASGTGCIGYQGDIDRWEVTGGNPCAVVSSTGAADFCGLQIEVTPQPGQPNPWSGDLIFELSGTFGGGVQQSLLGADLVFGDNGCGGRDECVIVRQGEDRVTVTVSEDALNDWSFDQAHCYTWTLRSAPTFGCPVACPNRVDVGGGVEGCSCN